MLAKLSSLPGLAASLVLAISALLLCNHYDCFLPWYESPHGLSYIPASRNVSGQSSFGIDTTSNLSTAKGIGLPFGHQDQVQEFSIPSIHFSKRIPLDLEAARCKGETLYQRMKKSYADYLLDKENNKGREFSQKDVDNGWSVVQHNDVELEGWWDQAFSDRITPGQTHDHLQDPGQFIGITQNKAFRSDQGGLVRDFQNKAHYYAWYVPAASGIVVTDSRSPEYELQKQYNGQLSTESISRSVPPLHRLSDSIWTIWLGITGQNSRGLRYIGRGNIINPDTISIMKALFEANRRTTRVPWPGITAGIDSMIGKVLLGTPNGIATGWLIVDHHSILGRRKPTVTIWTYSTDGPSMIPHEDDDLDNVYMMLWDLGPPLPY